MQEVIRKPKHTDSAHCRACRQPSRAELAGRHMARIMTAQREAQALYEERRDCDHPPHQRFIKVIPAEDDNYGRVLDGGRVTVCRVCLVQFGETF